jgi:hypothetical protein
MDFLRSKSSVNVVKLLALKESIGGCNETYKTFTTFINSDDYAGIEIVIWFRCYGLPCE